MSLPDTIKEQIKREAKMIENIEITSVALANKEEIDKRVSKIIHVTCAICAGVAIQPIPFADIFILSPIQGTMGYKIAQVYGIDIKKESMGEIIKEIVGLIGLGLFAQQFVIGLYKTIIPFGGAFISIPIVYSLTFGIGKAINYYFKQKAFNKPINREELQAEFKRGKKEGKKESKKREWEARR